MASTVLLRRSAVLTYFFEYAPGALCLVPCSCSLSTRPKNL